MILLYLAFAAVCSAASSPARGLPFTRRYSLEDIGYGPRGARLDFDRFGRVAVIHDGVYAVLNDTIWSNIADRNPDRVTMSNVISAGDGHMYYGARASWGVAETQSDGLLHTRPLVPSNPPDWIRSASFADLIATEDGVYFVSPNGIAFWDFRAKETQLYEHPRISRAFRVGNRVFTSSFNLDLRYVDIANREIVSVTNSNLDGVVELAAPLGEHRTLLSLIDGRVVVFDGNKSAPWEPQTQPWGPDIRDGFGGKVAVLHRLVDGTIALGITGKGLYLFSGDGESLLSLTSSEYHRITAIANREPGVLWVATEDGIEKILYSSALT
ncbi:MAG TPA: sensor histidine kinase, partial [Opitutus sp.]|nr:sensor histidine kinase [Opitutus sp.]